MHGTNEYFSIVREPEWFRSTNWRLMRHRAHDESFRLSAPGGFENYCQRRRAPTKPHENHGVECHGGIFAGVEAHTGIVAHEPEANET